MTEQHKFFPQNGESEQSELEQSVSPLSYAVDEIINPGQPQGLQGWSLAMPQGLQGCSVAMPQGLQG